MIIIRLFYSVRLGFSLLFASSVANEHLSYSYESLRNLYLYFPVIAILLIWYACKQSFIKNVKIKMQSLFNAGYKTESL